MLLGRPPFETTNLKETYRCIREARYTMPSSLLAPAKHLIASMLSKNPEDRPSLDDIIRHDFFLQVGGFFFFFCLFVLVYLVLEAVIDVQNVRILVFVFSRKENICQQWNIFFADFLLTSPFFQT